MTARRRLAAVTVALAVALPLGGLVWFGSSLDNRVAQRPGVGTVFPALPGLADGESLPPSPGRRRVAVFARAGCANCDRTIATLRRLAGDADPGFDLIAVVAGTETAGPKADGVHTAIADPDASVSRSFGVIQVPLVFLVDEHSRIQAVAAGERPENVWRSFLEVEADAP